MNQRRNAVITRKHSSRMRTVRFCSYSGYGIRGRVGYTPWIPYPHPIPYRPWIAYPLDTLPVWIPYPMPYPLDSLPLMPSPG